LNNKQVFAICMNKKNLHVSTKSAAKERISVKKNIEKTCKKLETQI